MGDSNKYSKWERPKCTLQSTKDKLIFQQIDIDFYVGKDLSMSVLFDMRISSLNFFHVHCKL